MPPALLCLAILFLLLEGTSILWLVRQPDATAVLDTWRGQVVCSTSKLSVVLLLTAMLVRSLVQSAPRFSPAIWAVGLVVAVVLSAKAIRQRRAGTWHGHGLAHGLKKRRRRGP
jgi:hypothetical protein